MKEKGKWTPHIIAVMALSVFVVLGLASAATKPSASTNDYSYPDVGTRNDVSAATFTPVGLVFVESIEIIDHRGNRSGSKITHEMFMREAANLKADDVINIRIDTHIKRETKEKLTTTTISYTGIGLAIKYIDAMIVGNSPLITPDAPQIPTKFPKKAE